MFDQLQERARRAATALADKRRRDMAAQLTAERPEGIGIQSDGDAVALFGRGLRRRLALDPALRALLGRLR